MRWILAGMLVGWTATSAFAQTTTQPKTKDPPKLANDGLKIAGKTFDQWVKEIGAKDPSKRETAIRMVCAFPPETSIKALPALLAEMRRHTSAAPIDLSVRCNLCMAIMELFSFGERIDAKTQTEAVSLLRSQLRDPQAILRYRAAVALGAIGPEARAAIPDLIAMLKDNATYEARQAAAGALGAISGDAQNGPPVAVLKSLYDLLHDNAYQVRLAAVTSLSVLGPPLGPSNDKTQIDNYVSSLLPVALKDPEPGLQIWARIAIIGATNDFKSDNITPIIKHATNIDPGVRAQAVQALGTIGPKAKASIPTLITCLGDPEIGVQVSSMWALGRMETAAVNALPILEKIAADPNLSDYVKRSAKDAADKINGK